MAEHKTVSVSISADSRDKEEYGWNAKEGERGKACERYHVGTADRQLYLGRARRCSGLTIISMHREPGANSSTDEVVPWQSMGARGVNNLSAKNVLALFPPGLAFIRLKAAKKVLDDILKLPDPAQQTALRQALQQGLSKVEMEFVDCVEEDGDRAVLFDTLRHMIVSGNYAIKFDVKTAMLHGYGLEEYVVYRDRSGTVVEAVIEDEMSWESAPVDIKHLCMGNGYRMNPEAPTQQPLKVYTRIFLDAGRYYVSQEVCGQEVPDSDADYSPEELPYLFLRWVGQRRENYGRSFCEDYEGDLQSLDGLWQTMVECAAVIAKIVRAVKPGGTTSKKSLMEAGNGEIITGDKDDVTTIQAEKGADMSVAANRADKIEARLEQAFLLYSPRQGERVTALEVQQTVKELETGLGGVYSNLVTNLQMPYARIKMGILAKQGRLTKLPKQSVKMQILTGAAALGRYAEGQALSAWAASVPQWMQQAVAPYINAKSYLDKQAVAMSVDEADLVLTEDQVQQKMQAAQQAQMAAQATPNVVKAAGDMMAKQVPDASATPPAQGDQPAPPPAGQ